MANNRECFSEKINLFLLLIVLSAEPTKSTTTTATKATRRTAMVSEVVQVEETNTEHHTRALECQRMVSQAEICSASWLELDLIVNWLSCLNFCEEELIPRRTRLIFSLSVSAKSNLSTCYMQLCVCWPFKVLLGQLLALFLKALRVSWRTSCSAINLRLAYWEQTPLARI